MPGFELIGKEEQNAVNKVFENGGVLYRYGWDEKRNHVFEVEKFEKAFAEKMGTKYALGVNSGTSALRAALAGLNIKPGDEVITQSYTFIATVEAIVEAGAIPVIIEIDKTLNMDPQDLKKKINQNTRAIIPVHMMGVAAKMDEILVIAKEFDIPVLEDNAQSCGGLYQGKPLGTLGDVGIVSFDFGKVLTTGEGGMIYTSNETIFKKVREYSDHGHELNPNFPRGEDTRSIIGSNCKMMELQGAIGLAQLEKLDYIISKQRENKQKIKEGIRDCPGIEFREIPNPEGDIGDSVVFYLKDRVTAKKFASLWTQKGFGTKNLPDALNWHFAGTWEHIFSNYEIYKGKDLCGLWSKSDGILRRAIAIPVLVNMDENMINTIIHSVHDCIHEL